MQMVVITTRKFHNAQNSDTCRNIFICNTCVFCFLKFYTLSDFQIHIYFSMKIIQNVLNMKELKYMTLHSPIVESQ